MANTSRVQPEVHNPRSPAAETCCLPRLPCFNTTSQHLLLTPTLPLSDKAMCPPAMLGDAFHTQNLILQATQIWQIGISLLTRIFNPGRCC